MYLFDQVRRSEIFIFYADVWKVWVTRLGFETIVCTVSPIYKQTKDD